MSPATAGRTRVSDFVRPLAEDKGITIQTDLAAAPGEFDPQRIQQVFINILSNTIKYNQPSDGWIDINGKIEANRLQVSVRSCGKTISPEDLPHLFDRFYRADKSRTRSREGSAGLGLAIKKLYCEVPD